MRAPRIVLGWDPGPTKCGFAILVEMGGRTRFLEGGTCPSTRDPKASDGLSVPFVGLELQADRLGVAERLCAVEAPGGYIFHQARGAQLLRTAHVAGELAEMARARGLQLVEMPAQTWRRAFCGRPNATDAMVKTRCVMMVQSLPKRSSAHVRDAIGVGWAALHMRHDLRSMK